MALKPFIDLENEDTYHWTKETYQQFGGIIYKLCSGEGPSMLEGYFQYFEFRSHFTSDEWFSVIGELDIWRAKQCGITVSDQVKRVRETLIEKGYMDDNENAVTVDLPAFEQLEINRKDTVCEQLCLF